MPNSVIYPTRFKGSIAFCNLCFESQRFGDLSADDVETIKWLFGAGYADDQPERAIELLDPMLAKWRAPDLLSPLGRAYLGVGRVAEGRGMLQEALSLNPKHPWSRGDRELLGDEGA